MDRSGSDSKEKLVSGNVKFSSGVSCFHRWLTVEPCLMVYFMAMMATLPLTDQYVLHVIQQDNNFSRSSSNTSDCLHNTSDPEYIKEQNLQAQASNMGIIFAITALLPSLPITTQLGGYSDKTGRKLALICPLIGGVLRCFFSTLIVYFRLPLQVLNMACVAEGLSGGTATFLMACFAYIADVTSHERRSFHIFLLEVAIGVGITTSSIGLGYLIKALGYMYPFVILCGLHLLNLIYVITVLRETIQKDPTARFFTLTHYTRILTLYMRDDGTRRRWKLQLGLLIMFLVCIPQVGSGQVLTYFQLDSPICFTSVDIGLWNAARYVLVSVSGVVAVKLFQNRLGDTGLMVVSCVVSIGYYTWLAFITSKLLMYLATLASVCSTLTIPMVRAFSSKLVLPDEQGVMFSAVANAQALSIPLANVILLSIYSATIKPPYFKGATFLTQTAIIVISLLLVVGLIMGIKVEKKRRAETEYPKIIDDVPNRT